MSFSLDINKFVQKCGVNADQLVRKTIINITESINLRSPVGDATYWKHPESKPPGYVGGHFRANWQLGVNTIPAGEIEGVDPTGTATLAKAQAAIPTKAAGHVYYYANNLPYAQRIEDGWSWNQAPHGVVGLTAIQFQGMISKALGELK